jgi:hypothetical protein
LKLAAATLEGRTMERLWIGNIALGTTDDGLPERNSIQRTAGTDHEQQLRPPFESAQQAGMSRMTDDRTVAESNQSGSAAL